MRGYFWGTGPAAGAGPLATIVNVIASSSLTLTVPPAAEIGVMPKSLCLMVALPLAVSVSPRTETVAGIVLSVHAIAVPVHPWGLGLRVECPGLLFKVFRSS